MLRRRRFGMLVATGLVALSTSLGPIALAAGPTYPSDSVKPDIVPALSGYNALWRSSGANDLHGTVLDEATLSRNDHLASWINQHATPAQQFRALQNSNYLASDGTGYDQSITIADGLGLELGALYVKGRLDGSLPLTSALINSSNGSAGAYIGTSAAKATFSYPRPYVRADPNAAATTGDADGCAPSKVNSSSLAAMRRGQPWADTNGNLTITRVPPAVDTTKRFSNTDITVDAGYGSVGLCTGGSYPSGHTTTAYEAGLTLATLLPQLAPEILARASEASNNRIVLGVHYPLDIIGGRIDGEMALSARWADTKFRSGVLQPARQELVSYLTNQCRLVLHASTLARCIAADSSYVDNPYGRDKIPGGTAQVVTDRRSALKVYTERLSYGFKPTSSTDLAPSVPATAENLLLTTYPTLSAAQRRQILSQTQTTSGHPLDTTAAHQVYSLVPGSWQRLNLAAAMSAKVRVLGSGKVRVVSTGGKPSVLN